MSAVEIADRLLVGPHGALRVRLYTPSLPSRHGLVWAHGGGFAGGDLDMPEADGASRAFAERGITVVSVEYRLAPSPERAGVHYPIASEEVEFAYLWARSAGLVDGPWCLGGASAGGNLAAGAILRLVRTGGPVPALAVLAYPTLQAVQDAPDAALRALLDAEPDADRFRPETVRGMYENYLGGPVEGADIFAIPGTATSTELTGFPPTIIIDGEADELRVSAESFARTLRAAGVEVGIDVEPGTQHGHLNRPEAPAAAASIDRFAARILALPLPARTAHE